MKFVKLHQDGREMLMNLSLVSEVYPVVGSNKSDLYLSCDIDGRQVNFRVDESLDEILDLSKFGINITLMKTFNFGERLWDIFTLKTWHFSLKMLKHMPSRGNYGRLKIMKICGLTWILFHRGTRP